MDKGSKGILIFDINACPTNAGLDMEKVMHLFKEHNVLFYDSHEGCEPTFIPTKDIHVNFVDLSKEENMKKLNHYKDKLK